jgi:photosystem II stability/assembly factor-like uncharacterized protein
MGFVWSRKAEGLSCILCVVLWCILFLPGKGLSSEWEWQNPLPQGNTLNAVWVHSGTHVFAAGNNGTILYYDGGSWCSLSTPTAQHLQAIWGSSNTDVFAVGRPGTIIHYDGTAWPSMAGGPSECLWGVWGTSGTNVYAVGHNGTVLHYDGGPGASWTAARRRP